MISKICVRIYKKVIFAIRKYPTRITIYDRIGKGKTNPAGVGRTARKNKGKAKEMENCMLCPRECGVNRKKGEMGVCGQTAAIKAARAALHMWEEPCISGQNGSGTVFFSGCNLGCIFCQNHNIATGKAGIEISIERLAEIFLELQEKGAACDLEVIKKDIADRDYQDMHREISPLKQAEDAILVDSSDMGIEEVVEFFLNIYREKC